MQPITIKTNIKRKRIREFTGETSEEPPAKVRGVRKRCQICPAKKDRKTTHTLLVSKIF